MFSLSAERGGYKYPRLIRYVTLESNLLAILDVNFNLLSVDKEKYDKLTAEDKELIIRTHKVATYCYLNREGITRIIEQ